MSDDTKGMLFLAVMFGVPIAVAQYSEWLGFAVFVGAFALHHIYEKKCQELDAAKRDLEESTKSKTTV